MAIVKKNLKEMNSDQFSNSKVLITKQVYIICLLTYHISKLKFRFLNKLHTTDFKFIHSIFANLLKATLKPLNTNIR